MYSSAYVWAKVLGHMESRLTPQVVSTWFDDTEILELTDEKLVLYSPSSFRKDIIVRRCTGYINAGDLPAERRRRRARRYGNRGLSRQIAEAGVHRV